MAGRTLLAAAVLSLAAFFVAAPANAVRNGPLTFDGSGGIHVANPDVGAAR